MTANPIARQSVALQGHVYTSRYQNRRGLEAIGGSAVRITLGRPRFTLGYELRLEIRAFAPNGRTFGSPDWEALYQEQLRKLGADKALQLLWDAWTSAGADIVLMCFEDVLAGQECHRRHLAGWLERETGLVVPELGAA